MKILFITLSYFPYSGACSSLLEKITAELQDKDDIKIHVIAMQQEPEEKAARYGKVIVHRVWWWQMVTATKLKSWTKEFPFLVMQGELNKAVAELNSRVLKNDFINKATVRAIFRKLMALSGEKYSVIIPIAGHYEAVQAALDYGKRYHTKVIVYQVDPCTSNAGYLPATKYRRLTFERAMYEESAAVITTPILLRETHGILPDALLRKATAMEFPNVNPHHQESSNIAKTDATCYTCVFAGAVYRQARNPAYTFQLFSALKDKQIVLHMIGAQKKQVAEFIGDEKLPENIKFFGTMPLEQAQQHMAEADVLINIGNIMTNQVPSKIFEYISSGKPIVNICTSHECPTLPYLEKYPYVLNLFECDPNFYEQVQQLEAFIRENAGKRVSADYIMRTYETCTAQYCAKQMLDVIQRVIS